MNIVLLIDLDNINNENSLNRVFVEMHNAGEIKFKYGFYSNFCDKNIKTTLQKYGIVPIMFPSFAGNKNCADISLTIKAMDLLANPDVDCYAIASNDSDFIALSSKLRSCNKKTILITDKELINKDMYNYFDEGINIYDLLHPKSVAEVNPISNKEISVTLGEKDEKKEETTNNLPQKADTIIDNVDNTKYINYESENDKIKQLLDKIKTAFLNIATENDSARLSTLVSYLSQDGKRFTPKDYDYPNNRAKEFFRNRLGAYFKIETRQQDTFIKFKEKGE